MSLPRTVCAFVCEMSAGIEHEYLQNGLHRTQHSVNFVVYEEREHDKNMSRRTVIPSFRGLRKKRLESCDQERLAFYDSGFPTEARVNSLLRNAGAIDSFRHIISAFPSIVYF